MINVTGQVKGDTAIARVKTLSSEIRAELRITVDQLGTELLERSKRTAAQKLNKAPQGKLVGAINKKTEESSNRITSTVGISLGVIPYARIHEFGGIITAKNSKYLVFKVGDAWRSVKQVTIPERSYLRASLATMPDLIEAQIRAALKRAVANTGLEEK